MSSAPREAVFYQLDAVSGALGVRKSLYVPADHIPVPPSVVYDQVDTKIGALGARKSLYAPVDHIPVPISL